MGYSYLWDIDSNLLLLVPYLLYRTDPSGNNETRPATAARKKIINGQLRRSTVHTCSTMAMT